MVRPNLPHRHPHRRPRRHLQARIAWGGLPAQIGFKTLSFLWLYTAAVAYLAIRRGNLADHRDWIIRNFALTFSGVTLRLWMPLLMSLFGELNGYRLVAWLAWLPNLLLTELALRHAWRTVTPTHKKHPVATERLPSL